MRDACKIWKIFCFSISITVEPLTNDHPHQRPSLLYDHISCNGQCFLFVRSLTNDYPSNATNDRGRWDFLPRERPLRVQCISKNRGYVALQHPFPWWIFTMLRSDTFEVIQLLLTLFYFGDTTTTFSDRRTLHRYNVASPPALASDTFVVIK